MIAASIPLQACNMLLICLDLMGPPSMAKPQASKRRAGHVSTTSREISQSSSTKG
jgi:hypothetical protein